MGNPGTGETAGALGWRELWLKEDWWAVWLGLGIIAAALILFESGLSLKWLAVKPAKWAELGALGSDLAQNAVRYIAQFAVWLAVFTGALKVMGFKLREFIPAFIFVYALSVVILALGAWERASQYNLEPPLVALALGLLISNFGRLPRAMDAGFRVEFYIKTGIVLLGATLPFTLIVWAGPVAILQASIVSITTFLIIFWAGRRMELDRRLCATMGAGGAVCGVSASIAIAAAVGAKKEHLSVAITLVIFWAVVMIFVLPLVARSFELHAGVAGAWIGTSEFADAAGFAAAQAYGNLAGNVAGIGGTGDQAISAFTLMKVVGRDVWIGIWAFILAIIATTRWETTGRADPGQIWWRFPKFVIGFFIASVVITWVASQYSFADYNTTVKPALVAPIKDLRTWAFTFCFLSIGLTTRFRELTAAGNRPFLAFSTGVVFNVILGFILSAIVFAAHWKSLAP